MSFVRVVAALAAFAVCLGAVPGTVRLNNNGHRNFGLVFMCGCIYVAAVMAAIAWIGIPRWGIE